MSHPLTVSRALALVGALGAAVLLSACANRPGAEPTGSVTLAGAATPGSSQDFVVNVGDRVFFETNSVDFTPTAIATLARQVQWLKQYPHYTFVIEGHADERGTREYNIALGAKRATAVQRLFRRPWRRRQSHAHHLLRQGATGRRLRRHLVLVTEPARRHRAQQRRSVNGRESGRMGRSITGFAVA